MKDNSKADISKTEEFDKMYREMVEQMEEKNCTRHKDLAAKVLKIKEEIIVPDNCEVWDDQGNVINTSKIIIREKKKEYPKTYKECCKVLSLGEDSRLYTKGYKASLIQDFQKLLICRDAYWKIAGEEIGLGKPWSPDLTDNVNKHCIEFRDRGVYKVTYSYTSRIFAFPTKEMRDAFYENFKELIESCKELL